MEKVRTGIWAWRRRRKHALTQRWSGEHKAGSRGAREGHALQTVLVLGILHPRSSPGGSNNEIQIMVGRSGGRLVSLEESQVLRPGERTRMLGMTVGDSGVFEKHQLLPQAHSQRILCEVGGLLR